MTVIAWDGTTLAADKRMTWNGSHATVTKIHRIDGNLVGAAGDKVLVDLMFEWVRGGMAKEDFPAKVRDNPTSLLVITPAGKIQHYTSSHIPQVIEDRYFAIGSGADYASAVMHLEYAAKFAVETACALDPGCGNGVDTLELSYFPPITVRREKDRETND